MRARVSQSVRKRTTGQQDRNRTNTSLSTSFHLYLYSYDTSVQTNAHTFWPDFLYLCYRTEIDQQNGYLLYINTLPVPRYSIHKYIYPMIFFQQTGERDTCFFEGEVTLSFLWSYVWAASMEVLLLWVKNRLFFSRAEKKWDCCKFSSTTFDTRFPRTTYPPRTYERVHRRLAGLG